VGKVEGVVMYCLDKTAGNADLAAVGALFGQYQVPESK
jgi:hypothetical protein